MDPSSRGESLLDKNLKSNIENDRLGDQWSDRFFKKNQFKTEKYGRRLRSAYALKKNKIL